MDAYRHPGGAAARHSVEGVALLAALDAHRRAVRTERARRYRVGWSSLALAVLVGVRLVQGDPVPGPPQPSPAAAVRPAPAASGPAASTDPAPLAVARPDAVRIPAIGVDAPLRAVGYDPRGRLDAPPPTEPGTAGWFSAGPSPGERGAAVLTGHVDTRTGPAVFYSLGSLVHGDTIEVTRGDGRTAVFTVDGVEVLPREGFPAERVYGDTGRPELRLLTCGGTFEEATGYDANVVVFAHLTGVR
ncbi:class F sortase [Streptomyces sp. NPDC049906]|uniref:class F sortase n=1 Tax=Streptomyces sp. NPDC049906 TaxID=3155656 RepID=UPI00342C9DE1